MNIPNHFTAKLSELDLRIVHAVPPGGNWKHIPLDVPSKRIAQIRESFAAGQGSRSTYYGRLLDHKPAYTINTYFNRPGNGCHIHYGQDRVLSQREAARLQSFPDSFVFEGSQGAINTQIGNAVPPLLAYQIARQLSDSIGATGIYVDLFAGAGGLGLGFKWAGWQPIIANDIEAQFLRTYARNVHPATLPGSITDPNIFEQLVAIIQQARAQHPDRSLWILGGPPCQGFSTAGNKRSMEDRRNVLFMNYNQLLREIRPDGFIFENVAGLLSMEKGKVFERVKEEFSSVMPNLTGFVLQSEHYAIPQKRKRVFLIGQRDLAAAKIHPPKQLTVADTNLDQQEMHPWITTGQALSDLPPLIPGQDGAALEYASPPQHPYQSLMRGQLSAADYLDTFRHHPAQTLP